VVALNIAGAAITAFGSYLPAFFAFFLPATIPCLVWGVSSFNSFPEATTMTLLMLLFFLAMSGLAIRNNQNFKELVHLRIRTEALARDLRKQKEVAEAASLAKSSFLAAASHDLRQPVHAIGLLVGALHGTGLPPEAVNLVERIEESTSAMDGLFSGILDISRLDAGVVGVHPEIFAIQPLLDRICNDYRIEAQKKFIRLVTHPCGALVETDILLIERIIRNLVSNAIRHTSDGRVVVGCRRLRDRIRVEVWDTGPGIPPTETERIFQEYFQLQNPERDRTMGLGLGLAIVRRLSSLLNCPVKLKSEVGQGSCFSVEIPRAPATAIPNTPSLLLHSSSIHGLVLVIDDELAIRDAMSSLLTTWGYSVITAGTGREIKDLLTRCPNRPDVIICDYRLRGDENGIDVVRELQTEFNEVIPAMLITGDTAPDRLVEAQASGLLLLHKPVPNGKLRAAIISLMGASKAMGAADGRT
jgi:signal transduction histidine kinase/ActR/RegA family two-component response regulator